MKVSLSTLIKTVLISTLAVTGVYFSYKEPHKITDDKSALAAQIVQLPLSFIPNQGQAANQVKYISRNFQHSLFFTENQVVISLRANDHFHNLALSFLGANSSASLKPEGILPSKSNYFIGNDPTKWQTNIANYSKLRYNDLYPGIDLVFYGNSQKFEYDFCVAPGADPDLIKLQLESPKELAIDSSGNLRISTPEDIQLLMHKPYVYQVINGEKVAIDASFTILAANTVGFKVADYNRNLELIIDPVLSYSTYIGGSLADQINKITIDADGNVFATGQTQSTNFPITPGAYQTTLTGITNALVLKLNPSGSELVYSTYLGGSATDTGISIQIDSDGNAYIAGSTTSADFPTTPGVFQTVKGALDDGFLTKLSPDGSSLVYSTFFGGNSSDNIIGLALDASNNAYVTGFTFSTNLPVTVGAPQPLFNGAIDAFITKFNSTATALMYSTYLGGSSFDIGISIALDSNNNAYVTGFTTSIDFPTVNAIQGTLNGTQNAFITKINAAGTAFDFSTYFGGSSSDTANGIAVDSDFSIYLSGIATSTDFPTTPGAYQTTKNGPPTSQAGFVTKFTPNATAITFSTYIQNQAVLVQPNVLKLGPNNTVYLGGLTDDNFAITSNAIQSTYGGGTADAFLTILNPEGTDLLFSTYLGGSLEDRIEGIGVDSEGNAYVSGYTFSTNFPVTSGAFQTSLAGSSDGFIAKISLAPTIISLNPSAGPQSGGNTVIITGTNFIGTTEVLFGGVSIPFTVDSNTQITVIAPAGTGIVDVVVITPFGQTAISAASQYAYVAFSGVQVWEKFATQTDVINILTWNPLDFGFTPTTVKIFRDPALTVLVATLPGTQTQYEDHNRKKNTVYTYYLVAYNSSEVPSSPVALTVLPRKK